MGSFPGEPGGDLVFTVDVAPPPGPPLEIDVTIDPIGSVDPRKGIATISGTISCSRPAFVEMDGSLRQRFGRLFIDGFFFDAFECEGAQPWVGTTEFTTGVFVGGRAEATVFAFAFDEDEFAFDEETATIRLRPSRD